SRSNKKAPPQRSLAFGIQNLPLPNPLNQTNDPSNHHRHFEKQPRARNTMVRSTSNLRQRLALSLSGVGSSLTHPTPCAPHPQFSPSPSSPPPGSDSPPSSPAQIQPRSGCDPTQPRRQPSK